MTPWTAYYEKADNLRSRPERHAFWFTIMAQTLPLSVLEVGCGDGLNLEHIKAADVWGLDTYAPSLEMAAARVPSMKFAVGTATDIGSPSQQFDLVFTCTVLQHIPDDADVRKAIRELRRVSRKWVLIMEYAADTRTPVLWRGDPEGIVKRPWWDYMEKEGLTIMGTGLLRREDGFDDVSWYLSKR